MRKIILFLLLVASVQFANAQTVGFGVKAGANLNKISGQEFKQGYELGYHVGLFSEIGLTKKIGLQPELLWNQINTTKAAGPNTALTGWQDNTTSIKLQYLTVPLLVRYNLTNSVAINLGPQYGILINQNNSTFGNAKEAIKSGDFQLVGGVTLNFSSLRIYGRYNIGLSGISDVPSTDNWKTQQIQFGVGYKIL